MVIVVNCKLVLITDMARINSLYYSYTSPAKTETARVKQNFNLRITVWGTTQPFKGAHLSLISLVRSIKSKVEKSTEYSNNYLKI